MLLRLEEDANGGDQLVPGRVIVAIVVGKNYTANSQEEQERDTKVATAWEMGKGLFSCRRGGWLDESP